MRLKLRKNQTTIPWEKVSPEVTSLEIISDTLEKIQDINHYQQLQSLYLNCPALTVYPKLPASLTVLKVKYGHPGQEWLEHLSNLEALKIVQLSDTKLDFLPTTFLEKAAKIESLDLKGNHLSDLPSQLKHLKGLSRINLDQNKFEELPSFLFEMNHLNHLSLDSNNFNEETVQKIYKHFGIWL